MRWNKLKIDNFTFEAGGSVSNIEVVYHTSNRDYKKGERVVWLCHALTANSNPMDWWPEMVGKGCCIDPEKDYVVCVNIFASPYGTTGPRSAFEADGGKVSGFQSLKDETAKRETMKLFNYTEGFTPFDFPKITVRDMARLFPIVREYIGIEKVDLLVGSSIGGFQALEWAVLEPEVIERAAFIATAPRVTPWLGAWMESQRMAIEADPTFKACESLAGGQKGLEAARALSLISYRTFDGYNLTQAEEDEDCLFAGRVASYERYQGEKLVKRDFDAYSYYYLTWSVDSHNVGRKRGGVAAALGQIKAKSVVITITSDGLFPPVEGREWAAWIPGAEYVEIESKWGHDGFLLETEAIVQSLKRVES
jgi:homoserine O-acetyltransferase